MIKVLTAAQMREVDRLTTERYGIPSILLMENAAHAVARVITEKLGGSVKGKSILILCGPGNNGGDGAAIARLLWEQGASCSVYLFGKIENTVGDARTNFEIAKNHDYIGVNYPGSKLGLKYFSLTEVEDQSKALEVLWKHREDVCVDALFGTGLSRRVEGMFEAIVSQINHWIPHGRKSLIVSVDVPSGLNSDSTNLYSTFVGDREIPNDSGTAVQPDITVTFSAPKIANILPPASKQGGELVIADIGTPEELINEQSAKVFLAERNDAKLWLRGTYFSDDSYKNRRGHALIIAGSRNYSGAAVLCGDAAIRSGCGLVTIATPESSRESIVARVSPEVMVRGLSETDGGSAALKAFNDIQELLKKLDVVAVGSGLSTDPETAAFVRRIVEERTTPVVIDADALTTLSPWSSEMQDTIHVNEAELQKPARKGTDQLPLVLTPHEGEFMRLLGTDDKAVIKDRVAVVRDFATKNNVFLVLKGERALIGHPDGRVVVNPTGNSGLGKAGNGDTLTGILAGFLAQAVQMKIDIFETVVAAVYIAGMAGDVAEKKYGKRVMTASDVRDCLVEVFASLNNEDSYL